MMRVGGAPGPQAAAVSCSADQRQRRPSRDMRWPEVSETGEPKCAGTGRVKRSATCDSAVAYKAPWQSCTPSARKVKYGIRAPCDRVSSSPTSTWSRRPHVHQSSPPPSFSKYISSTLGKYVTHASRTSRGRANTCFASNPEHVRYPSTAAASCARRPLFCRMAASSSTPVRG